MVLMAASTVTVMLSAQASPDIALPPGDAAGGKAIVEGSKGNCLSCHRIGEAGSLYGPELSAIGAPSRGGGAVGRGGAGRGGPGGNLPGAPSLTRQQLAQSLLDPNAEVSVQNRYVRLTMNDGRTIWGKLLNLDTFDVQIFDSTEKLANISRKDVRDMTVMSPMPSYRNTLTTQELSDVVEYLMSLRSP